MNELESVVKRLEKLEVQNQRIEAQNHRLGKQNRRLKLAGVAGLLLCTGVLLMGQAFNIANGFTTGTIYTHGIVFLDNAGGAAGPEISSTTDGLLTITGIRALELHNSLLEGPQLLIHAPGSSATTLGLSGLQLSEDGQPVVTLDKAELKLAGDGQSGKMELMGGSLSLSDGHIQLSGAGLHLTNPVSGQPVVTLEGNALELAGDGERGKARLTGDALSLADGHIRLSKSNGTTSLNLENGAAQLYVTEGSSYLNMVSQDHQHAVQLGMSGNQPPALTLSANGQVSAHVP